MKTDLKMTKRFSVTILFSLAILFLLLWSIRQISWVDFLNSIRSLNTLEISFLVLLNILIFSLFSYRWLIILKTMNFKIPFSRIFIYRLIGFGISYFTPGPQFGGEPAQIILLNKSHRIPPDKAVTSVYLDRLIDVFVNFTFLAFGMLVLIGNPIIKNFQISIGWLWIVFFVFIPPVYLIFLYIGKNPVSGILKAILSRVNNKNIQKFMEILEKAEIQIGRFIHEYPIAFLKVFFVSVITWLCMMIEYWLLLHFMGVSINGLSLISAMTAARLAFLTPLPGGIGALEAGQIWVMQMIGISSSIGISAAIYIRIRDSLFGLAGLFLASRLIYKQDVLEEAKL